MFFEPVRPEKICEALTYLKYNNGSKINDITIGYEEEIANPLQNCQQQPSESLVVNNNIYEIAPGEGLLANKVLFDQNCDKVAFPQFFSKSRFGSSTERETKLSQSKYFSQRLLNDKQSFTSNSDYIFFAQLVLQEKNFRVQISIAMKKKMGNFTAGMFTNYKDSVDKLVNKDQEFYFMNQIRGTPAYWKRLQYEVLAMIKQLGCPTFFLTLSCADLKWKEKPEIISKLNKLNLSNEYLESMNYFKK